MPVFFTCFGLSQFVRGLFIVCIAWSSLVIANDLAVVGLVFVSGHLVNVVFGPFSGAVLDRFNRLAILKYCQISICFFMSLPLFISFSGLEIKIVFFYIIMCFVSISTLTMSSSFDAVFQLLVNVEDRRRLIAYNGTIGQGSMVIGAGLGGFLIHLFSFSVAFFIGSVICLIVLFLLSYISVNTTISRQSVKYNFFQDLVRGFSQMIKVPILVILSIIIALSFSMGQLVNALLPGFVRIELFGDSDLYGLADAAWSVGGVTAAFLVARVTTVISRFPSLPAIFLAALGGVSIIFSFSTLPLEVVLYCFFLGALFSAAKVVSDGMVLEMCSNEFIGRVRVNQQVMISLIGICVYLTPALLDLRYASTIFYFWGAIIAVLGVILIPLCIFLYASFFARRGYS